MEQYSLSMVEWINVVLAFVQAICAVVALRLSIGPTKKWWQKLRKSKIRDSNGEVTPALEAPRPEGNVSNTLHKANASPAPDAEVVDKSIPKLSKNFGVFLRHVVPTLFVGLTLFIALLAYLIEVTARDGNSFYTGTAPSLTLMSIHLALVLLMLCLAYTDAVLNMNFLRFFIMSGTTIGIVQTIGDNLFGATGSFFIGFIPLGVLELMCRNPHVAIYRCLVAVLGIICSCSYHPVHGCQMPFFA